MDRRSPFTFEGLRRSYGAARWVLRELAVAGVMALSSVVRCGCVCCRWGELCLAVSHLVCLTCLYGSCVWTWIVVLEYYSNTCGVGRSLEVVSVG